MTDEAHRMTDRPAASQSWPNDGRFGRPNGVFSADHGMLDLDIGKYVRIALKHRLLIAGAFLAAVVAGLVVTMLSTPVYTASATIQIDRQATQVLDNTGDVTPRESAAQGEEFFQTQYGLLRSRSLAERVVDTLGLASSDAFLETMGAEPGKSGGTAQERSRQRRERVVRLVQKNFSVSPVRGSRLVTLSFDSPEARLSARLVNGFAEAFIQENLDRKFESTAYVREFLEDRIAQTKAKLEDAERQLVQYAGQQQIITLTESADDTASQQSLVSNNLASLNSALAQARSDRIAAEARWASARNTPLTSIPEVLANPTIQRLIEERSKVSAEYQQKLSIYRPEYPEMQQLSNRQQELDREIADLGASIRASINAQYRVAVSQEGQLQDQVNRLKGDVIDLRQRSIQYNILQREVSTSRTLYDALLQRYKEVGAAGGVTANNVSIIDEARPPRGPSKPNMLLNLAVAAVLGLGLGLLLAFVLEALDETLEKPEDVEEKLGFPVLGMVPLLDKGTTPSEALANPRSDFSEAYHSIRTALQFSTPEGVPNSLLITSSRAAEGKSTTAYAVAMNLARIGRKVLLADGDLRNPSLHRAMGVDNDAGVSNLLAGSGDLATLAKATEFDGLDFVPCGPLPPNPAELWGGDGLDRVLKQALTVYDHVIIDGPPVLGFADAPLLASAVQGTVLVVEARTTKRAQARGALRRLMTGNTRLLGVILTKFNVKALRYGSYDYAYDYTYGGSSEDSAKGRKAARR